MKLIFFFSMILFFIETMLVAFSRGIGDNLTIVTILMFIWSDLNYHYYNYLSKQDDLRENKE